jgi:hypothetical protein
VSVASDPADSKKLIGRERVVPWKWIRRGGRRNLGDGHRPEVIIGHVLDQLVIHLPVADRIETTAVLRIDLAGPFPDPFDPGGEPPNRSGAKLVRRVAVATGVPPSQPYPRGGFALIDEGGVKVERTP